MFNDEPSCFLVRYIWRYQLWSRVKSEWFSPFGAGAAFSARQRKESQDFAGLVRDACANAAKTARSSQMFSLNFLWKTSRKDLLSVCEVLGIPANLLPNHFWGKSNGNPQWLLNASKVTVRLLGYAWDVLCKLANCLGCCVLILLVQSEKLGLPYSSWVQSHGIYRGLWWFTQASRTRSMGVVWEWRSHHWGDLERCILEKHFETMAAMASDAQHLALQSTSLNFLCSKNWWGPTVMSPDFVRCRKPPILVIFTVFTHLSSIWAKKLKNSINIYIQEMGLCIWVLQIHQDIIKTNNVSAPPTSQF